MSRSDRCCGFGVIWRPMNIALMFVGIVLRRADRRAPRLGGTACDPAAADLQHVADLGDHHAIDVASLGASSAARSRRSCSSIPGGSRGRWRPPSTSPDGAEGPRRRGADTAFHRRSSGVRCAIVMIAASSRATDGGGFALGSGAPGSLPSAAEQLRRHGQSSPFESSPSIGSASRAGGGRAGTPSPASCTDLRPGRADTWLRLPDRT